MEEGAQSSVAVEDAAGVDRRCVLVGLIAVVTQVVGVWPHTVS